MSAIVLRASYARLASTAVAKGDIRFYLEGMRVEPREEGGAFIVATDGHRLMVIIDPEAKCETPAIIKPDLRTIAALPKVGSKGDTDKATLELTKWDDAPALLVRSAKGSPLHMQVAHPVIEYGKFPLWRNVIPDFSKLRPGRLGCTNMRFIVAPFAAIHTTTANAPAVHAFQTDNEHEAMALRLGHFDNVLYIVMPMRAGNADLWTKTFTGLRATEPEPAAEEVA